MKKKLHILFLCGWYPSRVLTNNGDFIQRHAEAVGKKQNVTVLHIISDKKIKQKSIEFVKKNGVDTYIGYIKKTKNPILKAIRFYKVYKEVIEKIKAFDVVHVNSLFPFGIFALHLKRIKKTPFIVSEHWTGYHYPHSKNISFIQKIISKQIAQNASYICPVTDNLANSMQKTGLVGNYKKIPNVVDTNVFYPLEKTPEEYNIIHISSLLNEHKNITDMLKVAKSLEDKIGFFNWKFIGGTSEKFAKLIKELDFKIAKIEFIDHMPQTKIVHYLQSSDVFVLFSNYENLPCVILESFSCGIPVITTNVGGISEFFPDKFGKLIPPKNKKKLLNQLMFYNKSKEIDKSKMHAYVVKHFSKQAIEEGFSKLYYKSIN
ncbi:MAG: glycosyltransferase family 4 protein [Polaribacter sp.]|nr:glycosyltransferase family 4 protein [Polaribacter sp.]